MHALVELRDHLSMESVNTPTEQSGHGSMAVGTRMQRDVPTTARMSSAVFPRTTSAVPGGLAGILSLDGPAPPRGLLARRRMTVIMTQVAPATSSTGHDLVSRSFRTPYTSGAEGIAALHDSEDVNGNDPQAGARPAGAPGMGTAAHLTQPSFSTNKSFTAGKSMNARNGKVMVQPQPAETPQGVLKQMPNWKQSVLRVLNHKLYYVFLFVTTLYIIFENDVKRAALPLTWDTPLESIIAVILVCLVVEMGLSSFVRPGYLLGFYFWVDCIVCASLFFEVPSVKSQILGIGVYPTALEQRDTFFAWVSNRAFISSQVARVARIFRLLRHLRLYSVYKRFEARRRIRAALAKAGIRPGQGEEQIAEEELSVIELEILQDQNKETRVGQKLEELIIRRIIVFVLVCMLILPIFEAECGLWGKYQSVGQGGLFTLHQMAVTFGSPTMSVNQTSLDLDTLPSSSFAVALLAILSISRSLFKIFFLMLGAWLLNRDSRVLVLEPIERMLARVAALAENPLALQPAAHAPWQEQLERMQQAQEEQAAAQLAATDAEAPVGGLTGRVKSVADMFFASTSTGPRLVPDRGSGQTDATAVQPHAHAVISLIPGSTSQQLQLAGQGPPTEAWADVNGASVTGDAASAGPATALMGSTGTAGAGGWRVAGASVTATVRLQHQAADTRWQRVKGHTQRLLRRLATNFWDGTDEDQPVAQRPGATHGAKVDGGNKAAQREAEKNAASYETQLLENSIQKIGALLAVGFGDAGAEIIAENIKNEGDINPMVPGRKTVAVFGFCDIRRFTDATEVLQEEVMEFVNSIARIVHTSVAIHGGAANKNIGDAFLLVWKLPKAFSMSDLTDACDHITMSSSAAANDPALSNNTPENARSSPAAAAVQLSEPHCWLSSPGYAVGEAIEEEHIHGPRALPTLDTLDTPPSPWMTALSVAHPEPIDLSTPVEPLTSMEWPRLDVADEGQVPLPSSTALPDHSPRQMKFSSLPPEVFSYDSDVPLPGISTVPDESPNEQLPGGVTSSPKWLLSVGDNRVAPLPSLESVPSNGLATKSKRMFSRGAPGNLTRTGKAGSLGAAVHAGDGRTELGKDTDLESEAVQRVMRMRSKGGVTGPASISVPEKAAVVSAVADNALMSFIIVHAALKRSVRLARYSRRSDLDARLGPNFRVQMGFGLHVGWAIEGAIGSEYKIDASYLSPNVNMASRLEAATKQFGVTILMSENFAVCLSADVRARVRQIDCVTVKGSVQPMGLFTYDINLDNIPEPDPDMPGAEEEEEAFWANYACGLCESDDMSNTWGVTPEFLDVFGQGFQAYKSGDWKSAHTLLTIASGMRRTAQGLPAPDKPAQVLISYMEEHGLQAPKSWRGFRELTEK